MSKDTAEKQVAQGDRDARHWDDVSDTSCTELASMDEVALRAEVERLTQEVSALKASQAKRHSRLHRFDPHTGLPSRGQLLERGSAEFRRAKRYRHHVSVLLVSVRGLDTIEAQHGAETTGAIFAGVAQLCESVSRTGIDLIGVFDRHVIGIVLPETRLSGALALGDRLKEVAAREPFQVSEHQVRPALNVAADAVLQDDEGIQACLTRAVSAIKASNQ
ncbi:MAG: diguanylate cyclase [Pseudomonadota bacterium]